MITYEIVYLGEAESSLIGKVNKTIVAYSSSVPVVDL